MKKTKYFEGWYIKHQSEQGMIAFIPSIHLLGKETGYGSIQVITKDASYSFRFSLKDIDIETNRFYVRMGENLFTEKGIHINLKNDRVTIQGKVAYSSFTKLRGNIMGIFHYIPFMQCSHDIISLYHRTKGTLKINGQTLSFQGGTGYIERDSGNSFPKNYVWTENQWQYGDKNCVVAAVAHIPFWGISFQGCICCILYKGRQYRLATYNGAKVISNTGKQLILSKAPYTLKVNVLETNPQKLDAPIDGNLERTIMESPVCKARYEFYKSGICMFDIVSEQASFEFVP